MTFHPDLMAYIPHRQVIWSHPVFFSTMTLQPAKTNIGPSDNTNRIKRGLLGLGHRIHSLSPASSSNAASSQSCGASMFTSREQSRHQTHSQACMHMRILDRSYPDNSKRFCLAHLCRKHVRECRDKGFEWSSGRNQTHFGQVAGTTSWDNSKSIH